MPTETLDLSALQNALASLQDSLEIVGDAAWFSKQPEKVQNTLLAGAVKNFEFVYELGVKMLKRRLELDAASPDEIDAYSFRELLRSAAEKGLVADVEAWFQYRALRNITSHTYDHAKARQVYAQTLRFLADARALLAVLERRNARSAA